MQTPGGEGKRHPLLVDDIFHVEHSKLREKLGVNILEEAQQLHQAKSRLFENATDYQMRINPIKHTSM